MLRRKSTFAVLLALVVAGSNGSNGVETHSCAASSTESAASWDGEILGFTATWCPSCRRVKPTVSRLVKSGRPIRMIDFDRNRSFAQRMGVTRLPCFIVMVKGREQTRITGALSEGQFHSLLRRIPKKRTEAVRSTPELATSSRQPEPVPISSGPSKLVDLRADAPVTAGLRSADAAIREASRDAVRLVDLSDSNPSPFVSNPFIRSSNPFLKTAAATIQPPEKSSSFAEVRARVSDPHAASVRIHVKAGNELNGGAGSLVDLGTARPIVLTCAHLFRDTSRNAKVTVDLFDDSKLIDQCDARLIASDDDADVAIIELITLKKFPAVPIAVETPGVRVGETVISYGCGGGAVPTSRSHRVTSINRYLGPANVECTGAPETGRSGGGLFSKKNELVGVCFAADRQGNRGIYAGLAAIHELLDRAGLSPSRNDTRSNPFVVESNADHEKPTIPTVPQIDSAVENAARIAGVEPGQLTSAEVVCIIRPKGNAQAPPRVVVIPTASRSLLSELTGDPQGSDDAPHVIHRARLVAPAGHTATNVRDTQISGDNPFLRIATGGQFTDAAASLRASGN